MGISYCIGTSELQSGMDGQFAFDGINKTWPVYREEIEQRRLVARKANARQKDRRVPRAQCIQSCVDQARSTPSPFSVRCYYDTMSLAAAACPS